MKKFFSFLLFITLLSSTASAQLLWKITSPASSAVSYLLGTHHFAPADMASRIPGLEKALSEVTDLYGEIDMSVMTDPMTMAGIQQLMVAPADSSLSTVLGPERTKRLADFMTSLQPGIDGNSLVRQMDIMKPAAVSSSITAMIASRAISGFNPMQQLDATMQNMARDKGLKVHGLETAQWQMQLLMNGSLARQADQLMEVVDNSDRYIGLNKKMIDAYLAGDLSSLNDMILDPTYGFNADESQRLIYDRNDNWTALLSGILSTASVIIVVGAGHLPGPKGVICQLRDKGYTITPVNTESK